MAVKVKICGIRRVDVAIAAVESGADFLGLNFVPNSKRKVDPATAKQIVKAVAGRIPVVGIFRDEEVDFVNKIAVEVGLDYVQLHGLEGPYYCKKIVKPVIKKFALPEVVHVSETKELFAAYSVAYYLIDREKQGEGDVINFVKARSLAKTFPLFIAGGLKPETVADAVRTSRPYGVDVASGIETNGKEDSKKIRTFITQAKKYTYETK